MQPDGHGGRTGREEHGAAGQGKDATAEKRTGEQDEAAEEYTRQQDKTSPDTATGKKAQDRRAARQQDRKPHRRNGIRSGTSLKKQELKAFALNRAERQDGAEHGQQDRTAGQGRVRGSRERHGRKEHGAAGQGDTAAGWDNAAAGRDDAAAGRDNAAAGWDNAAAGRDDAAAGRDNAAAGQAERKGTGAAGSPPDRT